ncbi:hypothetical protein [Neobacillus niacini]|nr:hypothetical protein [Neobacillus niacini]MCM3764613.1 hypothetical protein [Neobacillus niacini]
MIDHLDGDKFNNLKDNLDWTSQNENVQRHLLRIGKKYTDKLKATV